MTQREFSLTVEPLVLEGVPFGKRTVDVFAAHYDYAKKLFAGYATIDGHAQLIEFQLTAQQAALYISSWVHGWLTDNQRTWLYNHAATCPKACVIVEIGAWKGKSSIVLGWGSKGGKRARLLSIDPHEATPEYWAQNGGIPISTWPQYLANVRSAGLDDVVVPFKDASLSALDYLHNQPVGLLFIDADHDRASQDAAAWFEIVRPDGWIAMHDNQRIEVQHAVQTISNDRRFERLPDVDNMSVLHRLT